MCKTNVRDVQGYFVTAAYIDECEYIVSNIEKPLRHELMERAALYLQEVDDFQQRFIGRKGKGDAEREQMKAADAALKQHCSELNNHFRLSGLSQHEDEALNALVDLDFGYATIEPS